MENKIGIIGNGFVGSAIAFGFGLHADINIYDVDKTKTMNTLEETINGSDIIFICVPTPMHLERNGSIDLTIMKQALASAATVDDGRPRVYVIKSTVIPGTTEYFKKKYPNLRIVFNPEFLTERSARLDFINASRIVLGGHPRDTKRVSELYRVRFPHTKIIQTDSRSAEFIKYICNCFFATKVSFMNEMHQVADRLKLDWDSVMDGFISDGRMGNSHFDVPGHDGQLGFGGKCFPKDINAFIDFSLTTGVEPVILKAVWEKNLEVRADKDWLRIKGAITKGKKQ